MAPDRAERHPSSDERPTGLLGSPVAWFVMCSMSFMLVLILGTVLLADRIAQRGALDQARDHVVGLGAGIAGPLVDGSVRAGEFAAVARLDRELGRELAASDLRHLTLWDATGRVLWSDDRELMGQRLTLPGDVERLMGTDEVTSRVSDLSRVDDTGERAGEQAIEVFVGAVDDDGRPFVIEAELRSGQMQRLEGQITSVFIPLVVGVLLLFQVVTVPLAILLTRRVRRAQRRSSNMTRHALRASDLERRRIAENLHDGVVQDLAGLSYAMPRLVRELRVGGDLAEACSRLEVAAALVQKDVGMLRTLTTSLYPPDLEDAGLHVALQQLVHEVSREGDLRIDLAVDPELRTTLDTDRLVYRVVREALRNVLKHARARSVIVEVGQDPSHAMVRVADDGRGPGDRSFDRGDGHLGLRLLRHTIEDVGGTLEVGERPHPGGTTLVASFPSDVTSVHADAGRPPQPKVDPTSSLHRRGEHAHERPASRDGTPDES